jgi:hypothetical protein
MRRVDCIDPPRIETFSRDSPLEAAKERFYARRAAEPTVQIWAETVNVSGAKRYFVGPHELLWKQFMNQDTTRHKRIGDEVYLDNQPGRLVFDLDGKDLTPDDMKAFVVLVRDKVLAALQARYGLTDVVMRELDGSRDEKQSRHLFFDGAIFADIRNMQRFVAADVMPGLPVPEGLIDMAIYQSSSRCLRLPLAAKFGQDRVMAPVYSPGVIFDFSRSMVNVLPDHRPDVLLIMPIPEEVRPGVNPDVEARILRYLAQWSPNPNHVNANGKLRVILRNLKCPRKGAVHNSNNGSFTCGFGRDKLGLDCITYGIFKCYDPACEGMYWRPSAAIDYIAYPQKLEPRRHV